MNHRFVGTSRSTFPPSPVSCKEEVKEDSSSQKIKIECDDTEELPLAPATVVEPTKGESNNGKADSVGTIQFNPLTKYTAVKSKPSQINATKSVPIKVETPSSTVKVIEAKPVSPPKIRVPQKQFELILDVDDFALPYYQKPFVPLSPPPSVKDDYRFCLGPDEGIIDLFDMDCC